MKLVPSFRRTLIINTVIVAAMPLLIVGIVTQYFLKQDLLRFISQENMAMARSAVVEVQEYLKQPRSEVRHLVDYLQEERRPSDREVSAYLASMLNGNDFFESLILLDNSGRVRQAALAKRYKHLQREYLRRDWRALEIYAEAIKKRGVVMTDTFISAASNEPVLTIAHPFPDGIVLATFDLRTIQRMGDRITEDNGYTYLVNRQGRIFVHPDRKLVQSQYSIAGLNIVKGGREGKFGSYRYDFQGVERLGNVAMVPETGWLVVVAQRLDEVFVPFVRGERLVVTGMLAAVLLAWLAAIWSLDRLLRPLQVLGENVQRFAGGDNEQAVVPSSFREIDLLASHFNQMAATVAIREEELRERHDELAMTEEELRQQVDEYQRSQDELCASNQALQALFTASPLAIVAMTTTGEVTLWNPAAEQVFGWGEGSGEISKPLIALDGQDEFWALRELVLKGRSITGLELQRLTCDNRQLCISLSAAPLYDTRGNITGIMSVSQDITSRREVETTLRKLSDTFLHSQLGMVLCSSGSYNMEMVNPAFAAMHGYTPAELAGKPLQLNYPSELHDELAGQLKQVATNGHHIFESWHLHSSGSTFPVMIDATAVFNEDGDALYTIINVQDISRRKEVEAEILKLNADLEQRVIARTDELAAANASLQSEIRQRAQAQEEIGWLNEDLQRRAYELELANRELESFSYSVSHDLRAPLRHINGYSRALLEDYGDNLDDEGRNFLERICRASVRMGNLINDLLDLASVTRHQLIVKEVDLSGLAQAIARELQEQEPEREVRFAIAERLFCSGDPLLLRQALQNLIGNAWKYTAKTTAPVIELNELDMGGRRGFFVRDNGVGFDMTYADRLFMPFQRLHTNEEFEGTGIGLAIVKRVVDRHGGEVRVEAEPGRGATFYFSL